MPTLRLLHAVPSATLAAAVLCSLAPAQQLVLPDNMNLGSATSSAATVWRATAGRFQAAYDSSHFTNGGVTGPIVITRLRFRPEDGQRDLGGQVYTGVTVEVGNCAVDHAALSATFAANRGTMGAPGTTNVTVLPVGGGIPNDYAIDIDLAAIGATFLYDPTAGTDLLVDVTFPAPAPATNLVPFSVGSSTVGTARGRMLTTATPGAATGGFGAPPTLLVDFAGPGGYAAHNAARSERYGAGCAPGGLASFYQDWQATEPFDLANTSLVMSGAGPSAYVVVPGATPPDLTKLNATPRSVADDAVVTHPLGFTLNHPGGSTSTIVASTNGFVWLDSAMTNAGATVAVADLMGLGTTAFPARLAPCWFNFHAGRNTATTPNAGLHVLTDTSAGPGNAACYVTWYHVGVANQTAASGTSVSDFQCVIHENGSVEYRYGAMQVTPASLAVTGWSPGRIGGVASRHPGPRDLSHETPFFTALDGGAHALTHNATARPVQGTSIALQAFNHPAGTLLGAMLISFAPQVPASPLPQLAPGCGASLSLAGMVTFETFLAPTGTVTSSPLAIPVGFMGASVFTQYAALDAGGVAYASNGVKLTVGLN